MTWRLGFAIAEAEVIDGIDTADWRAVTRGFATDFATPADDWHTRVARWCVPEFAHALSFTDPDRLDRPAPAPAPLEIEIAAAGHSVIDVIVGYPDGQLIHMRLSLDTTGWRVAELRRSLLS